MPPPRASSGPESQATTAARAKRHSTPRRRPGRRPSSASARTSSSSTCSSSATWAGREDVRHVRGAERVVADDEVAVVLLDDDPARQRAGRLGPERAQRGEAARRVRVDVAGHEAGDEVLLRRAHRVGGAVELARLVGREADVERGVG